MYAIQNDLLLLVVGEENPKVPIIETFLFIRLLAILKKNKDDNERRGSCINPFQ